MDLKKLLLASVVAVGVGVTPAMAAQQSHDRGRARGESGQRSNGNNNGNNGREQRADGRSGERRSAPAPQAQPRAEAQPRQAAPPPPAPRAERAEPRNEGRPAPAPRVERVDPRYEGRSVAPAPRGYTAPRAVPRAEGRPYVYRGRTYFVPRFYPAPRLFVPRFYRPGLTFSFGVFFGNPYPYRWAYPVPVPVPYGYDYPAYPAIAPGSAYGGIAFAMSPSDASVFVDGQFVGIAETFDGRTQPLTLSAGRHRIQLQAEGYEPMAFDVDVQPGQVIPYQGSLQAGYSYPY